MKRRPSVLYLHGFASSPESSKATYLSQRFTERGIEVRTPDLNLPDFSTLTVTRMLEQADDVIGRFDPDAPIVVVGSSLGGFVGVHTAARRPDRVHALVLLAPALDFGRSTDSPSSRAQSRDAGTRQLGEMSVNDWRRAGTVDVFHYAYRRTMPVHYALYEDASRYNALDIELGMPIVVFQGRHDDTVDPVTVEAWSRSRPNVELHMLDDDHQLGRSLPYIWETLVSFLALE
jgi:pimeloyl-ACP methyl ester carboxylesterase